MGSRFDDIRTLLSFPTITEQWSFPFCISKLLLYSTGISHIKNFQKHLSDEDGAPQSNRISLILALKDYLICTNLHYRSHFPSIKKPEASMTEVIEVMTNNYML